jgi:hypothetical protein
MPASTIILPGNFGAWSGPGYASGLIIVSSDGSSVSCQVESVEHS